MIGMSGLGSTLARATAALLIWSCFVGSASAQQPTQAQASAIKQACRADYQSHCANVPTGGSAALACLQQNAPSLSSSCQRALSAVGGSAAGKPAPSGAVVPPHAAAAPAMSPREEAAVLRNVCGADYQIYCRGVRPGGGRAVACLRENGPSLSPGCQHALMSAHGR